MSDIDGMDEIDDSFEDSMAGRFDEQTRIDLLATSKIANGFYTIQFRDGSRKTFRVHTGKADSRFAPGKRIVSLLIGPEKSADYEGVAFLTRDGIVAWKRFKGTRTNVHLDMLWDMMNGDCVMDGCELVVDKRCNACNRKLKDAESVKRNFGPSCWERMNVQS